MIAETRAFLKEHKPAKMKKGVVVRKSALEILDIRMQNLTTTGFVPDLKVRKVSQIWQSGINLQANEYRSLMQVV